MTLFKIARYELSFFAAIAIFAALMGCSKKEMRQKSSNMEPAIKSGEVVIVDFAAYTESGPKRWDAVVFESPIADGEFWLSRVVGLPGETIDMHSGEILIDGKKEVFPAHLSIRGYQLPKDDLVSGFPGPVNFPYEIPAGEYFILGDNVSDSLDSRYWGSLDGSKILGKVSGK